MRLAIRRDAFDHPDYLYELKYDGFRALADIRDGQTRLISRRGNVYRLFDPLRAALAETFGKRDVLLDGEIVVLDAEGRPQFYDLLRRRGTACFVAFDILSIGGEDLRARPLIERKAELARIVPENGPVLFARHVDRGIDLFRAVCERDLEGIVAKWKYGAYVDGAGGRESSTWFKIKNPHYTQQAGRAELFERRSSQAARSAQ